MEDVYWGSVLIDGFWRAAPVDGVQWNQAEWRVRVGKGRSGALAAVKRAKKSNQFRAAHPNKRERYYNRGKSPPRAHGFYVTPSEKPPLVQITKEGFTVLEVRPETAIVSDQAKRTHPDWDAVGHPVSVKIGSNYVDLARAMGSLDDHPTISQAIHRLIYAGICELPPAFQDSLRGSIR